MGRGQGDPDDNDLTTFEPLIDISPRATSATRLNAIEADTQRLLDEARPNGWDGEAAGLETTLLHITEKKNQVERIRTAGQLVLLELAPPSR